MRAHTHTHTHIHTQRHKGINTQIRKHTNIKYNHARTHARVCKRTHTHATDTRTRTPARTRARAHTHLRTPHALRYCHDIEEGMDAEEKEWDDALDQAEADRDKVRALTLTRP